MRRRGGFVAGVVAAFVAAIVILVLYLAYTDDDADGQLEVEVPNVEVDIEEQ